MCQLIFEIHRLKKYISVGQVLILGPFQGYQFTNYHYTVDPSKAGQNTVDQVQVTPESGDPDSIFLSFGGWESNNRVDFIRDIVK